MKNKIAGILLSTFLMAILALSFVLSACINTEQKIVEADMDTVEKVVCEYLAEEVGKNYGEADVCIPWVNMVGTEVESSGDVTVYGDFWVDNYDIKDETLECVSGGNHAGVMKMTKDGDSYKVTGFKQVEDGENYTRSAKKLFGTYYEAFAKFQSDDAAKKKVRTKAVAKYVKEHNLKVTQYHDYGWDPVTLPTK